MSFFLIPLLTIAKASSFVVNLYVAGSSFVIISHTASDRESKDY